MELGPAIELSFKAQLDGAEQHYLMRLPPGFTESTPHDFLIALHGHGSDRHQYASNAREECRAARDMAAKHGMVLVCPDYRGASWMGPAAEADMVQLIGELKQEHKIRKIIMAGASMGGTSVLIFTALHPELIDGVVSENGIASMMEYDNDFAGISDAIKKSYGGGTNETLAQFRRRSPAEFRKRSPVFVPERFTMPVAITVGQKDTVVPPKTTIELAEAIQKTNPDVLIISRPDTAHLTSYADTVTALEFVIERVGRH
jgi:pimeloyl-ACP methyl ester carboxylesterase